MTHVNIPEIHDTDVLAVLRDSDSFTTKNPHARLVMTFKKHEYDEDIKDQVDFEVTVRCSHPNYLSLIRNLYKTDQYGFIRDGSFGIDSESFVPHIRTILTRLQDGGYINIGKQECTYHSDYNKRTEYDEDGPNEIRINPKRFFTKEEQELLGAAVVLTTKGKSRFSFVKENILAEPVGALSLIVSIIALVISVFLTK